MATKSFNNMEENASTTVSSGVSLLKNVVGLSPVAAGVWYGQRSLKANEAVNNPLSRATPSQAIGKAQGLAARRAMRSRNNRATQVVDKLRQGLGASDELRGVISKISEHNALLQSLSTTLENPASGLDTTAVQSLKSEIDRLLGGATPDSVEEFAERVTRSLVNSATPETLMKWEEDLSEFRKISTQLETPNFSIPKTGMSFNPMDVGNVRSRVKAGTAASWEKRFGRLEGALPQGHQAKLFSFTEGGVSFKQAQVFNERGRWVASVGLSDTSGKGANQLIRSGESFNTLYAAPRYAMDVSKVDAYARQRGMNASKLSVQGLEQAKLLVGWNDHVINEIGRRSAGGRKMDWGGFRTELAQGMQGVNRAAMSDGGFGRHVRNQAVNAMNSIYGFGFGSMDRQTGMRFVSELAQGQGMDPGAAGAKRLMTGFGNDRRSTIGLARGSGFNQLQKRYGGFAVDRRSLPITARESQILGRGSMSLDPLKKVGSMFTGGIGHTGVNSASLAHGWGGMTSGGVNNMMVIDFSKKGFIQTELADTGAAITGRSRMVAKPVEYSVMDPRKHGYAASSTVKKILHGNGKFSASDLAQDLYLGETSGGRKYMPRDPHAVALKLSLDRTGSSAGKEMIYFRGRMIRKMDYVKLFSMSFKGNLENIGNSGIDRLFEQDARLGKMQSALAAQGITGTMYDAAYAGSDMFGKGSFSFTHQIAGSARMFGVDHGALKTRAEAINSVGSTLGKGAHASYAQAAFELMSQTKGKGSAIGMTLAGVFHGAEGGGEAKYGLNQKSLLGMIQGSSMAEGDKKNAIAAMKRGLVSFVDTAQVGPSVGDWGAARVGLESRFAKTAYERMRQIGMSEVGASNAVAGIYTKKLGFGKHYAMAEQLMNLGRSVTGQRGVVDAVTERGATRMSYSNMAKTLSEGTDSGQLNDFLRKQKNGLVLDFADAPSHINRAVKDVFGMDSLFLPGTAAYDASTGTNIKQAGGASIDIASAYGQMIKGLQGKLESHNITGGDALRDSLRGWRTEAVGLLSQSVAGLAKGKLQGSSSPRISQISLTGGIGMSDEAVRASQRLFRGTGGSMLFADATMMLSELHGQKGAGATVKNLGESARMFFTGLEHAGGNKQLGSGLIRMGGRHPFISAGNAFVSQVFRDIRETSQYGKDGDAFFKKAASAQWEVPGAGGTSRTVTGAAYMKELFGQDIKSFRDIAVLSDSSRKGMSSSKQFFESMMHNISQFTGGQGGGKLTFPRMLVDGFGDIGLAPQAYADMDGDSGLSMTFDAKTSAQVRKLLRQHNKNPSKIAAELQGRVLKGQLGSRIKEGMIAYGETLPGVSGSKELIRQDIMKEMGIAQSTGQLDVRLRPMHDALLNMGGDINRQRMNRDLLGALEENVLLKAKKLKMYAPLAEELGTAMQGLMANPGQETGDVLRDVLKNKIFRGQSEAFSIGQMTGGSGRMGKWISQATAGHTTNFNLDSAIDDMVKAAIGAGQRGDGISGTAGSMAHAIEKNPFAAFADLLSGIHMESAALRAASGSPQTTATGVMGKGLGQLTSLLGKVDRRMTVPIAIGAAASMLALGAVGAPAYASESLSMPGEHTSPQVQQAIAQGGLFQSQGGRVSPEQLGGRPSSDHGMLDRPINSGSTYMERPSSYNIYGKVPNGAGISSAAGYIGAMTGSRATGSIKINDTRRPITRSYVDRLMGEY